MRYAIVALIVLLGLWCPACSQSIASLGAIADAYCHTSCGFGACGSFSAHNATYTIAPDPRGYTAIYFGYPLNILPVGAQITNAKIFFASITLKSVTSAPFSVAVLPVGSIVNETSRSGSTVDQSSGSFFQCPGSELSGTNMINFNADGSLVAPLDLTDTLTTYYLGGAVQFVIVLTPTWNPFSGGSVNFQSRSVNAQASYALVTYTAGTTTTTIAITSTTSNTPTTTRSSSTTSTQRPTTSTTTTTTIQGITTTTTVAPTTQGATTTTIAPTVSTTSTQASPGTTTTSSAPTTIEPGSTSGSVTTSSSPTAAPELQRNNVSPQARWALCFVVIMLAIILLV